jgi:thiol-disulfide isomerase/thioredoxin
MRIARALGLALAAALAAPQAAADEPLQLETLDGAAVAIGAPGAGAATVLHFWATWCPACKAELGDLDRAARACEGTRVEVIAVDVGEEPAAVRAFLADAGLIALRVLVDPGGRVWRRGGGREMPANRILGAEGSSWTFGPSSEAVWRERLAALGCAALPPSP